MTHALLTVAAPPVDWVGYLVQGGMLRCIWPLMTYYEEAIAIMTAPLLAVVIFQVHENLHEGIRPISPPPFHHALKPATRTICRRTQQRATHTHATYPPRVHSSSG